MKTTNPPVSQILALVVVLGFFVTACGGSDKGADALGGDDHCARSRDD